jgi:hypothetical protein
VGVCDIGAVELGGVPVKMPAVNVGPLDLAAAK